MRQFILQKDRPLHPNALWSRPVASRQAGRLLVIGGHAGEFSAVQNIYKAAEAAGAGSSLAAIPDSLKSLVGPGGGQVFLPSGPAGSIGKAAAAELLALSADFDAFSIGANLSLNSETTITMESVITKAKLPMIFYDDILPLMKVTPQVLVDRPSQLVIATMQQLFKLAGYLKIGLPVAGDKGLPGKTEVLSALMDKTAAGYLVYGPEIIAAHGGEVVITPWSRALPATAVYGIFSVFWMQNQTKPLEGLASASWVSSQAAKTSNGQPGADIVNLIRKAAEPDDF